jgi:hypothetical protein
MEDEMRIKKNIGRLDRTLRVIVGLMLFSVGLFWLKGQILIMVFGLFMLGIGLIGFCPVYVPFGISTRKGN